jgi:hypothetical protein
MEAQIFKETTSFRVFKPKKKTKAFNKKVPNDPNAFNKNNPADNDWGLRGFYTVT